MKRLSRCTDGAAHVFDMKILDVMEVVEMQCRYCLITFSDVLDELERYEFSAGIREHEEEECDV